MLSQVRKILVDELSVEIENSVSMSHILDQVNYVFLKLY